jgi:hypothetical protein
MLLTSVAAVATKFDILADFSQMEHGLRKNLPKWQLGSQGTRQRFPNNALTNGPS